jgi:exopolysaccharide biosynthesis polyprenyl glycosylphosphotransferase
VYQAVFAHQRKKIQLLFAFADAVVTVAAFEAAYATRQHLSLDRIFFLLPDIHILLLALAAIIWVALGAFQRVYDYLDSAKASRLLPGTLRQSLIGTALIVLVQYLLRLDLSRSFLFLFFAFNILLSLLTRLLMPRVIGAFQRGFGSPYHVVLVGSDRKTSLLADRLRHGSPFRLEIVDRLSETECLVGLPLLIAKKVVDEVIFDVESSHLSALEEVFLACDEEGVRTRVAIDFFPHVNSDITLDRVAGAPLLTFSAAPLDDLRLLLKRFFDIVFSAVMLIAISPLLLVIGALIKLTSPGPIIFRQARCGLNGRRFTLYKFRSMIDNAQELRAQLDHLNEREIAFKIARDPRVTPLGRWLRKFSLDELPQFFNVLRGDMSIVGPRPPLPEEVEQYARWQRRRLRMRPGLTCLWAVAGRDRIDFNAWMRMDISYIENWSLQLDWSIILRTIPHVLAGRGAH